MLWFAKGETVIGPCGFGAEFIQYAGKNKNGEPCAIIEEYTGDKCRVLLGTLRKIT